VHFAVCVNAIFARGIANAVVMVYNTQNMNKNLGEASNFGETVKDGNIDVETYRQFLLYLNERLKTYINRSTVDAFKNTERVKRESESFDESIMLDVAHTLSKFGTNVSFLKKKENAARNDASEHMYDDLTGLPHRAAFRKYLEAFPKKDLCFMMIDGKGLKGINDVLGRGYGDDLIVSIANALKEKVRDCHYMCRYGGDEFLVGFLRTSNEDVEKRFKERIHPAFHEKMSDLYINMPKAFVDLRCGVASTMEPELQKEYGDLPYMDYIRQVINEADRRQNAAKESEDEREINKMAMMRYVELDQRGQVDPENMEKFAEDLIHSTRKEYYKIKFQLKKQLEGKETK
jgi:diguanylate cyclase (GGDEF)-like protein